MLGFPDPLSADTNWVNLGAIGALTDHFQCTKCWQDVSSDQIPDSCDSCGNQNKACWKYRGKLYPECQYECPACNTITQSDGEPDQCSGCGWNSPSWVVSPQLGIDFWIEGYRPEGIGPIRD